MKIDSGWLLTLLVLTLAYVSAAQAQEDYFIRAQLSGDQVTGTVDTAASGQVTAVLVGGTLVVVGNYQDLSSPIDRLVAGGAHIHTGAKGENGGIAFSLNIDGGTEGGFTGIFTLTDEEIETLKSGQYYVQLHTETNQPGELRGQLAANAAVADLVGIWERDPEALAAATNIATSPVYVQFAEDGTFQLAGSSDALNHDTFARSVGRYELQGTLLIVTDEESPTRPIYTGCEGVAGTYQLELSAAGGLHLNAHNDPCASREPWLRQFAFIRSSP